MDSLQKLNELKALVQQNETSKEVVELVEELVREIKKQDKLCRELTGILEKYLKVSGGVEVRPVG